MKTLRGSAFFTSILIVALLVVALSTATFAWFSANNVVNVSSISFIAQTRDGGDTPGDLQIAWEPVIETPNFLIDFAQPIDSGIRLTPIMPLEAPVIGATKSVNALGEDTFAQSFTSGIQENGIYVYDGFIHAIDDADITPYRCVGRDDNQLDYYLINKNFNWGQIISVNYTITGELADKLCIAIFIDDTLQFVLSNTAQIYYGTIEKNAEVSQTKHVDNLITLSNNNTSAYIPPNSSVKVTMYAWYNGVTMRDSDVDKSAILSELQFKAQPTM